MASQFFISKIFSVHTQFAEPSEHQNQNQRPKEILSQHKTLIFLNE